jgi:hypothetical protein
LRDELTLQLMLQFVQEFTWPPTRTWNSNVAMFKCENAWGAFKKFTDASASSPRALKHGNERTQQSTTNHESLGQPIPNRL